MKKIQILLLKVSARITGNYFIQRILYVNSHLSQLLMGIGTGGSTEYSGEWRAILELKGENPPYCIFDVGSNQGQFLRLILNNLSTNDYHIHCFEPAKETFDILTNAFPKDKRIIMNNIGLARDKGDKILYYEESGSALASLTKRDLDWIDIDFCKSENVKIDTIDNYYLDNGIK